MTGTSESTRKGRFTDEQSILSKCIKKLLALYYLLDPNKPGSEFNSKAREALITFFAELHGENIYFDEESNSVVIPPNSNRLKPSRITDKIIDCSPYQFKLFFAVMKDLSTELKNANYEHFLLLDIEDHITSTITPKEELEDAKRIEQKYESALDAYIHQKKADGVYLTKNEIPTDQRREIREKLWESEEQVNFGPYENEWNQIMPLVDDAIKSMLQKESYTKRITRDDFRVDSTRERRFKVRSMSEFGKGLINPIEIKKFVQRDGDDVYTIRDFHELNLSDFSTYVRLILAHYHLAFGNFKRIKICTYNKCGKLFFEKKKGCGKYCRDTCRVKSNKQQEPEAKRKCRARHKAWAQNKYLKKYLNNDKYKIELKKFECAECKQNPAETRTGSCEKVLGKICFKA